MKRGSLTWAVAVGILGIGLATNTLRPATGVAQQPVAGLAAPALANPRYTVVMTEGTNLLVVDNGRNTMYYYTVDQGKEVGDDLKLRGTIDLNEVGGPVVKPRHYRQAGATQDAKPLPSDK